MSSYSIRIDELKTLLQKAKDQGCSDDVQQRLEWFLHFAQYHSVSETCRKYSIARTTFYRWLKRFNPDDFSTLEDQPTQAEARIRSSFEPSALPISVAVESNPEKNIQTKHSVVPIQKFIVSTLCALSLGLLIGFLMSGGEIRPMNASVSNQVIQPSDTVESIESMNVTFEDCESYYELDQLITNCTATFKNE